MKLTKLQRYTIYCILLDEIENYSKYKEYNYDNVMVSGLCWMFSSITSTMALYENFKGVLPELYDKRTSFGDMFWTNWEERRVALIECIKETHP